MANRDSGPRRAAPTPSPRRPRVRLTEFSGVWAYTPIYQRFMNQCSSGHACIFISRRAKSLSVNTSTPLPGGRSRTSGVTTYDPDGSRRRSATASGRGSTTLSPAHPSGVSSFQVGPKPTFVSPGATSDGDLLDAQPCSHVQGKDAVRIDVPVEQRCHAPPIFFGQTILPRLFRQHLL